MRSEKLRYTKGYKYRTEETYIIQTNIIPGKEVKNGNIILTKEGILIILAGYSSDGPSGPTIDTKDFMPGAFVHDALYELLRRSRDEMIGSSITRQGKPVIVHASFDDLRKEADRFLRDLILEDGMWKWRANYIYKGVRMGGFESAFNNRKIYSAP